MVLDTNIQHLYLHNERLHRLSTAAQEVDLPRVWWFHPDGNRHLRRLQSDTEVSCLLQSGCNLLSDWWSQHDDVVTGVEAQHGKIWACLFVYDMLSDL